MMVILQLRARDDSERQTCWEIQLIRRVVDARAGHCALPAVRPKIIFEVLSEMCMMMMFLEKLKGFLESVWAE